MTYAYFKSVQCTFPDLVLAEVYRKEKSGNVLVANERFFFGTKGYRLKRANNWADNFIKVLKKHERTEEYL